MSIFKLAARKPGWLCINLMSDRVDLSHVVMNRDARPEILMCDSYRKEGGDLSTLKHLRRELDLGSYRCTTLLKAPDYQVLNVDAPNVPAAEMKSAVRWSLKDLIDYPVEAATVDAVQIPGGGIQKLLAIAARNDTIGAVVKPFNESDIPLEVIDIPELAQRNVAHCYEEPGRGLVLLTFNEQGGLLTFTCDGELYSARRMDVAHRKHGITTLTGATTQSSIYVLVQYAGCPCIRLPKSSVLLARHSPSIRHNSNLRYTLSIDRTQREEGNRCPCIRCALLASRNNNKEESGVLLVPPCRMPTKIISEINAASDVFSSRNNTS